MIDLIKWVGFFLDIKHITLNLLIPTYIPKNCLRERERESELDAQRQYMVIGTLALLLIFLCNFLCKQGSGPGGDRRG